MKKILCVFLFGVLLLPVFAFENISFTPSIKLSSLGFEPGFAVNLDRLELEFSLPVKATDDTSDIYTAEAVSVAFNTKPFSSGFANTIGLEYMILAPDYSSALFSLIEGDSSVYPHLNVISLFYRAGINFTDHFGLVIKARQPLYIFASSESDFKTTILSDVGFFESWLLMITTISAGVKYTF